MGFYIKDGYELDGQPHITKEMAHKLLNKLFSQAQEPSYSEMFTKNHDSSSSACAHIGEYIHDLMYHQDYSLVDLTIEKEDDGHLIFKLNKTE